MPRVLIINNEKKDTVIDVWWCHPEHFLASYSGDLPTIYTLYHLTREKYVKTSLSIVTGHQAINAELRKCPSEERLGTVKRSLWISEENRLKVRSRRSPPTLKIGPICVGTQLQCGSLTTVDRVLAWHSQSRASISSTAYTGTVTL